MACEGLLMSLRASEPRPCRERLELLEAGGRALRSVQPSLARDGLALQLADVALQLHARGI